MAHAILHKKNSNFSRHSPVSKKVQRKVGVVYPVKGSEITDFWDLQYNHLPAESGLVWEVFVEEVQMPSDLSGNDMKHSL